LTRLLCLAATTALFFSGCDACSSPEPESAAPESVEEGSAESAFEAYDPNAPVIVPRVQPEIEHVNPPVAADFDVPFVAGAWRTSRGDNHRSGLRDAPGIRSPDVAWSVYVGIQGYANTPIVTGGGVFVSSQGETHNRPDELDGVYAIDPSNGARRWFTPTDDDANGMLLVDDVLFVGTDAGTLYAIATADGAVRWQVDTKCGITQAPTAHRGWLYLPRREGLLRVATADGQLDGDIEPCRGSERGTIAVTDDAVVRSVNREVMQSFDHDQNLVWEAGTGINEYTGRARWTHPQETASMWIEAVHRWRFGDENAFEHRPAAIARWADNGQLAWVVDINDPEHADPFPGDETDYLRSAPFVVGERLLWTPMNASKVVAFDVVTGERLGEMTLPDCRCRQFASIVGTPSVAYLARHDGLVYGFDPHTMQELWHINLGLHGLAGTSETHLPVTGACSELPKNGTALFSTPAIAEDGRLYVGSGDGWLYAVDPS
jgi:outer membrane protein assembly factor BamB